MRLGGTDRLAGRFSLPARHSSCIPRNVSLTSIAFPSRSPTGNGPTTPNTRRGEGALVALSSPCLLISRFLTGLSNTFLALSCGHEMFIHVCVAPTGAPAEASLTLDREDRASERGEREKKKGELKPRRRRGQGE